MGIAGTEWYDLFLAVTMRDAGVQDIVTDNVRHFQKFAFVSARRIEDAA